MTKTLEERAKEKIELVDRLLSHSELYGGEFGSITQLIADQQARIKELEAEPTEESVKGKFSCHGVAADEALRIDGHSNFISLNDKLRLKEVHEWVRKIYYESKTDISTETTEEEVEAAAFEICYVEEVDPDMPLDILGREPYVTWRTYYKKHAKAALEAVRKARVSK